MRPRQGLVRPALVVLCFLLTLPAVTTRFYASDEVEFYSWARSWWFDHDASFENEYQHFYDVGPMHNDGFHATFLDLENEAGRRFNFAPIGCAILWMPFFAAGHVVALARHLPADGYSQPYITAVTYASAFYGFLAVVLSASVVGRLVGRRSAVPALAVWIGTPLIFYMYVAPGFGHACSAFAVSLFVWLWIRARRTWSMSSVALLALSGALMAMVREQDVLFLVGPALDYVRYAIRSPTPTVTSSPWLTTAAAGALTFAVAYSPQLLAYQALNGHPGPSSYVVRKMTWTSPHFIGVLFSTEHGLLVWTPLALLSLLGLASLAFRAPSGQEADADLRWIACLALVMFAVQIYVNGCIESWTVAGSFGQRRFVATTPLLALGLAGWQQGSARFGAFVRTISTLLVALAIWWNLGLMAQFGLHWMDRQRLDPVQNARVTFFELPASAPGLAWRYLTDRSSLFSLPDRAAEPR